MPKSESKPQKSDPKPSKIDPKASKGSPKALKAEPKPDSKTVKVASKGLKPSKNSKAPSDAQASEPQAPKGPRVWPKGGPSKADLKRYRQALLDVRRSLLSSSRSLAAEALKASGQDVSVDHMADHGSDNYEQDFSLKLLEGESEQLADIREALMKIDGKIDQPYGLCEACTDDPLMKCGTCPWIPPSRLDVLPHTRLCVQTKELQERGRLS